MYINYYFQLKFSKNRLAKLDYTAIYWTKYYDFFFIGKGFSFICKTFIRSILHGWETWKFVV